MPRNSSASVFGGAGGGGTRASVSSLQGLRNVMRNEPETDSAPAPTAAPNTASSPPNRAASAAPADDKQTLRGLNDRLGGFLGKVKQLESENRDLEAQIDDILARRKTPDGRNWDDIQKPLDELKEKIKDITKDNANLLLQIDNTNLANNDLKNKLEDEKKARKAIEKDLEDQRKTIDETKLKCTHLKKDIELVKNELESLKEDHKDVKDLREKIKDSEVRVEIKSEESNLADVLNKIRVQYDELAKKNLKDTDDWYQRKFENIKVVEAQNTETLKSGKEDLKELLKEKQLLQIKIQSALSTIHTLEESVSATKVEYSHRLTPLYKMIRDLEAELKEMRSLEEHQHEVNTNLLYVKMKLEEEINNYQQLIHGMTTDPER
uniref:IF rod domain-containing protein n=1 Tax=Sphaeramia orbicularis TaxID=375764 RepID=A0A673C4X8_9TELE